MSVAQGYIGKDRFIHTAVGKVEIKEMTTTHITFEVTDRTATIFANLYCY